MSLLTKICNFIVEHSEVEKRRGLQGPPGPMGMMGLGLQELATITVIRENDKVTELILRNHDGYKLCSDNVKVIDIKN